jgi:sigma-B regulation protein RsbU (phosphoserine phosphatase)
MTDPPARGDGRRTDEPEPNQGWSWLVLGAWTFPATDDQVEAARRLARKALTRCWTADLDLVALLVSELVTNSVSHSKSERFSVALAIAAGGGLRVAVTDEGRGATTPHMRAGSLTDEGGRGMRLVDHFARRWGVTHEASQVSVWFELDGYLAG